MEHSRNTFTLDTKSAPNYFTPILSHLAKRAAALQRRNCKKILPDKNRIKRKTNSYFYDKDYWLIIMNLDDIKKLKYSIEQATMLVHDQFLLFPTFRISYDIAQSIIYFFQNLGHLFLSKISRWVCIMHKFRNHICRFVLTFRSENAKALYIIFSLFGLIQERVGI